MNESATISDIFFEKESNRHLAARAYYYATFGTAVVQFLDTYLDL